MTMCTLQVNAYHLGRGLRPVNKNRNKDGKAQDKKMYRVYQSHEQQQQHHKVIIRNKLKEMNLLVPATYHQKLIRRYVNLLKPNILLKHHFL